MAEIQDFPAFLLSKPPDSVSGLSISMTSKKIDGRKTPAAIVEARSVTHPAALALQGGDARKRFSGEMIDALLQLVAIGLSAKEAALQLGVSPGAVHQRAIDVPEFRERLDAAYAHRTIPLKDTILEVAYSTEWTAAHKKVIIEALQWTAKVDNRARFGDQVRVDAVHSIPTVVLPTIALPSIPDAEFTSALDAIEAEIEAEDAGASHDDGEHDQPESTS